MIKCPTCNSYVDPKYNYCTNCRVEMPHSKLSFVYDQLFELMKQENETQLHLDSKANTYIGILSIAVTIFGTLGGLLTVENINLMKTLDFSLVAIMYIIYLLIIVLFIISVLFAFKAYHTGAPMVNANDTKKKKEFIDKKFIYTTLKAKSVLDLLNEQPRTKYDLIVQLMRVIEINRELNFKKLKYILWAFRFTVSAIILILIIAIYISIISIRFLR